MIFPTPFGPVAPAWRTQASLSTRAFIRLMFFDATVVDLRLAFAAAATRSLAPAADALVRQMMGRAWQGARFAEHITAAATMVAAARH